MPPRSVMRSVIAAAAGQHDRDQHADKDLYEIELITQGQIVDGSRAVTEDSGRGQHDLHQNKPQGRAFDLTGHRHQQKRQRDHEKQRHSRGREIGRQRQKQNRLGNSMAPPIAEKHALLRRGHSTITGVKIT